MTGGAPEQEPGAQPLHHVQRAAHGVPESQMIASKNARRNCEFDQQRRQHPERYYSDSTI